MRAKAEVDYGDVASLEERDEAEKRALRLVKARGLLRAAEEKLARGLALSGAEERQLPGPLSLADQKPLLRRLFLTMREEERKGNRERQARLDRKEATKEAQKLVEEVRNGGGLMTLKEAREAVAEKKEKRKRIGECCLSLLSSSSSTPS